MNFIAKQSVHGRDGLCSTEALNRPSLKVHAHSTDIMIVATARTPKTQPYVGVIISTEDAKLLIETLRAEIAVAESRRRGDE